MNHPPLAQSEERLDYFEEVPRFESRGADHLSAPEQTDHRLHRRWDFQLGENLLCETGIYLRRWRLETPWFSIRVHHWLHSDDNRAPHDHPWDFVTLIIRGTYLDESPDGPQRVKAGRIYYRSAEHAHWVHLDRGPVWTLVLTGPKVRRWGFWVQGLWTKSYKYFHHWGNHPCD